MTVSSFASVSLAPPLVLIAIARSSVLHGLFEDTRPFAVNFLADDQRSISDKFAGRTGAGDRFEGVVCAPGVTGSPIIQGSRAAVECRSWRVYDGGDHTIVVGEVVSARTFNTKRPLVFYSQQYTTTELREFPAPPSDIVR